MLPQNQGPLWLNSFLSSAIEIHDEKTFCKKMNDSIPLESGPLQVGNPRMEIIKLWTKTVNFPNLQRLFHLIVLWWFLIQSRNSFLFNVKFLRLLKFRFQRWGCLPHQNQTTTVLCSTMVFRIGFQNYNYYWMEYCSKSKSVCYSLTGGTLSFSRRDLRSGYRDCVHLTLDKLPFLTAKKTSQLSPYLHQLSEGSPLLFPFIIYTS